MTKLMILGGVAAFVLLTVGILTSLPARADNNANSQLYPNGRYALVEGEIDVAQLQQGGRNSEQKVMLKIDTTTGQVWVLQLSVNGPNDPTVRSAVWAPVANDGSFNQIGRAHV